ncbi:hypothetical protein PMW03_15690, partial [Clostridium paraputrificum]
MKIKQILSALLVIALTSTGVTVGVNAIESKYDGKHQLNVTNEKNSDELKRKIVGYFPEWA